MTEETFEHQEQRRKDAEQRKNLYLSGAQTPKPRIPQPLSERYVVELSEVHKRITEQNNISNQILGLLRRMDERQTMIFSLLGLRVELDAEEKEIMDLLKSKLKQDDEET